MTQMALQTGKGRAFRRTIAAVVFAAATTIGGCGQFPQCQVYFKGEITRQCTGFLDNIKNAREDLRDVEGHMLYVKEKLRGRVMEGEKDPKGLDTFNEVTDALKEVSGEIERFKRLETRVKRGEATEAEVTKASKGILEIIKQLEELGRKLISI